MFTAIWLKDWAARYVYAVDPANNKFLISSGNEFIWVDMNEFIPI